MNNGLSLAKLYINSTYGVSRFLRDLKYNKKNAAKTIGIIVLVILSLTSMFGAYLYFNIKIYDGLKKINQQGIVITLSVILSTMLTITLGIITVVTNYFYNQEGDIILSLPINKKDLLFAKFINTYILEAIITFVFMGIGVLVYGIKSNEGLIFYIVSILATIFIPLIPLVICYFLVIPLMKIGNMTKKKDFLMIIGGLFGILVALVYQYLINSVIKNISTNQIIDFLTKKDGLIDLIGRIYYPSILVSNGVLNYKSISGVLYLISFILLSILIVYILLITMSELYYNSIIGSSEVTKRKREVKESEFKKIGLNKALFLREIKLMNREPVYFLNGPLVIFIIPLLFLFMLVSDSQQLVEVNSIIKSQKNILNVFVVSIIFLGASTSITSSCISREGSGIYMLKTLPIRAIDIIKAKFLHGALFGAIAAIIINGLMIYLKFSITDVLLVFIIGNLWLFVIYIIGILIDLRYPKLDWDTPTKAMKQNINVVITLFISMAFIGLIILIGLIKNKILCMLMITLIPIILLVILYNFLIKNLDKLYSRI